VAFESPGYRGLHVRGRARFSSGRCRERVARPEQRHIETPIKAVGKHCVCLIWLTGFANHAITLQFEFPGRATATAAEYRTPRSGAPVLEFAGVLKHELQIWPVEIAVATFLFRLLRFLQLLVRNRLAAENHRDRLLVVDCRLVR